MDNFPGCRGTDPGHARHRKEYQSAVGSMASVADTTVDSLPLGRSRSTCFRLATVVTVPVVFMQSMQSSGITGNCADETREARNRNKIQG